MGSGRKAYGLIEMMVAMTILAIVAAIALPRGWGLVKEYRLRGAAYYFRGLIREVRAHAAAKSLYTGIVFDEIDGEPELSLHVDGNDNGIRRADVRSGVDPRIRGPWRLSDQFPGVRYGSPSSSGGTTFPPLRIGRGRILSFSPIGTSTSGTLFLSNEQGFQYAVIILGTSGRVRLARYRGGQWEPLP
ncbi:MAG TPA: prepilin-type N-terminal cleavage/methylation domain-containing protein [Vicinamibacteria bacterium]|jgi:prepilin-type N-terminal cleavage/methylation domain-containing protein